MNTSKKAEKRILLLLRHHLFITLPNRIILVHLKAAVLKITKTIYFLVLDDAN